MHENARKQIVRRQVAWGTEKISASKAQPVPPKPKLGKDTEKLLK